MQFAIPRIGEEAIAEPLWKGGTQPLGVSHNPVIEEPWVGVEDSHLRCSSHNYLGVAVANWVCIVGGTEITTIILTLRK